jgi:hypothetical protein
LGERGIERVGEGQATRATKVSIGNGGLVIQKLK